MDDLTLFSAQLLLLRVIVVDIAHGALGAPTGVRDQKTEDTILDKILAAQEIFTKSYIMLELFIPCRKIKMENYISHLPFYYRN